MKWWNNIWLNESFAEFFAYLCSDKYDDIPEYDIWLEFFMKKIKGMKSDSSQATTHPIVCEIEDTF